MSAAGKRILVIEDNLMLAETYVELLRMRGYEVPDAAVSGEAALKAVENSRPDLVLVDISLKGSMDGIETARRISDIMDLPFIFISGHSDPRTKERMGTVHNHRFLMKPVDFDELGDTIAGLLGK